MTADTAKDIEFIKLLNDSIGIISLDGSFYCYIKTLIKQIFSQKHIKHPNGDKLKLKINKRFMEYEKIVENIAQYLDIKID